MTGLAPQRHVSGAPPTRSTATSPRSWRLPWPSLSGRTVVVEGRGIEFSLFLPANREGPQAPAPCARKNALDSNDFHKRFDARRPERNRTLLRLITRITGAQGANPLPASELARLMQISA